MSSASAVTPRPPRRRPLEGRRPLVLGAASGFRLLPVGSLLIVAVLVALPLLTLMMQAVFPQAFTFNPNLVPSLQGLSSLIADPYALRAGVDSLLLGVATAALASALGLCAAYLLEMTDLPLRPLFSGFVWLIFLSPSFLLAQGWQLLIGPGGILVGNGSSPLSSILLSPVGVMMILALKLFPFAVFALRPALRGLGSNLLHAARSCGAPPTLAWRRILIPLLVPALVSGALIVFAEVLGDFGVAATVAQSANFPLTTYAIYTALGMVPVNFAEAAAMSMLLVLSVAVAQWGQRALEGRRGYATRIAGSQALQRTRLLPRARRLALSGMTLLVLLAFVLPALATVTQSLMGSTGSLAHFVPTLVNYRSAVALPGVIGSLDRSFVYAAVAACIGLVAGILLALSWRGGGTLASVQQAILTVSIAVPGIVLGAGYIFFWNQPFLNPIGLSLYGTPAALLLAYVAGSLPYAVRMMSGSFAQVPVSSLAAARSCGAGLFVMVRRIILPQLKGTWAPIWLMLFASVVFELPVSELLYPPGAPTLSVAIVHQMHNMHFGVGAALTVMSSLGVAIVLAVPGIYGRFTRPSRKPRTVAVRTLRMPSEAERAQAW